jgi:hypothetical protein
MLVVAVINADPKKLYESKIKYMDLVMYWMIESPNVMPTVNDKNNHEMPKSLFQCAMNVLENTCATKEEVRIANMLRDIVTGHRIIYPPDEIYHALYQLHHNKNIEETNGEIQLSGL